MRGTGISGDLYPPGSRRPADAKTPVPPVRQAFYYVGIGCGVIKKKTTG